MNFEPKQLQEESYMYFIWTTEMFILRSKRKTLKLLFKILWNLFHYLKYIQTVKIVLPLDYTM